MRVFVRYKIWVDGGHTMQDGYYEESATVVELSDPLELNDLYPHMIDVRILKE